MYRESSKMHKVAQTFFVGDGSGRLGNCMQAAVASLLELPLGSVPHFAEAEEEWWIAMLDWADTLGYSVSRNRNKKGWTMMTGASPRGEFNHAVVAHNGELVWDPHPSGEGLLDALYAAGELYQGYADYYHFRKNS